MNIILLIILEQYYGQSSKELKKKNPDKQTQTTRLNNKMGLIYYITELKLSWNKYPIIHCLIIVQLSNNYGIMTSYI